MDLRTKVAGFTSIANLTGQIVHIVVGLVSVPLIIGYLGSERFGLLMTLSSIISFVVFSDLGLGIGVQDRMSVELAKGEEKEAKKYFWSAISFVLAIAFLLVIMIELSFVYLDYVVVFNISNDISELEVNLTIRVLFYTFVVGIISGIFQRAFIAMQKGYVPSFIILIARVMSLGLLFIVVNYKCSLPILALVMSGLANLVMLLVAPLVLFKTQSWIRICDDDFKGLIDFKLIKILLKIGSVGLLASIGIYLINSSSQFIIGTKYSLEEAAIYATIIKITGVPVLIMIAVTSSFWPALTDAYIKKDVLWISHLINKLRYLVFVLSFTFFIFIYFSFEKIIVVWTNNNDLVPTLSLVVAVLMVMVLSILNAYYSVLLNGFSKYKNQGTSLLAIAIIFSVIAYLLPPVFALSTPVYVTAAGLFIRCCFMSFEVSSVLRKLNFKTKDNI